MKDFMSKTEEEVRGSTLMSNATCPNKAFNEHEEQIMMQEEAHYVHTIKDVVELMIVYGQAKVMEDIMECSLSNAEGS